MSPLTLLSVQSTLSLIIWTLLARWYVTPLLAARSREEALVPLLWVQVFRYAPVALYAPGQVDGGLCDRQGGGRVLGSRTKRA